MTQPARLAASGSKLVITVCFSRSSCVMGNSVHFAGSACRPFSRTSKWRWHPVDDPVVPTCAMTSPTRILSPLETATD